MGITREVARLARLLGLTAMTVTALAVAACGSDDPAGTATEGATGGAKSAAGFTMGRFTTANPFLAGEELGVYDRVDVTVVDVESGPTALPLLTRGDLAGISNVSEPPLVIAQGRNIPIKIVWTEFQDTHSLLVRPGIDSASDLRGKKIAAAGGSILQVFLEQYLAKHGLSEDDIRFIDLAPADMVGAYSTGAIDGAYVWKPPATAIKEQGAEVLDEKTSAGYTIFSAEFVEKNPDAVQAFACDLAEVHKQFAADPHTVWNALAERLDLDPEEIEAQLPEGNVVPVEQMASARYLAPNGQLAQRIVEASEFFAKQGDVIDEPLSLEDVNAMIDTRFIEGVNEGKCT